MVKRQKRISERRLVDVLVHHSRSRYYIAREVPHYEKRIDIVTVDRESGEVGAIEVKVSDWLQAMAQAVVNLAAADKSYIAIHSSRVHRVDTDELERTGVGLIAVGSSWGDVELVKDAKRSPYSNRITLQRLRATVAGGSA